MTVRCRARLAGNSRQLGTTVNSSLPTAFPSLPTPQPHSTRLVAGVVVSKFFTARPAGISNYTNGLAPIARIGGRPLVGVVLRYQW
jgi:hypothetical protein